MRRVPLRLIVTLLAVVAVLGLGVSPASGARPPAPPPSFVELQGHLYLDDYGYGFYGVAFFKNSPVANMQARFKITFHPGGSPMTYVVPLAYSQYKNNPVAMTPQVAVPASATSVELSATLEHVTRRAVVDKVFQTLSGTGSIHVLAPCTSERIIYVLG